MLRAVQVCQGVRRRLLLKARSASAAEMEYEVEVILVEGQVNCSCPGFKFRGTCHHTHLEEERCGWQDDAGEEVQTQAQVVGRICPRCGSHTREVMTGASAPEDVSEDSEAALRARGVRVPMPPRSNR